MTNASAIADSAPCERERRLRRTAITLILAIIASLAVLMIIFDIAVTADGALKPSAILIIFAVGAWLALREIPSSRAGLAALMVVLLSIANACGAALGMLMLRLQAPQADGMLLADASLGINVVRLIDWTAEQSAFNIILSYLYALSLPLFLITVGALALAGRRTVMWRACVVYAGTLITVCFVSAFLPAKGAFLLVSETTRSLLPSNVGVYAFETFDFWHAGAPESINFALLNGVVTFPSFHTAAALVVAQAWWTFRKLRPLIAMWCALVIYSTIPIGGHYAVDIIGGTIVFIFWSVAADRIERRTRIPGVSRWLPLQPAKS